MRWPAAGRSGRWRRRWCGSHRLRSPTREHLSPFRSVLARVLPTWPAGPQAGAHLVDPVVVLGEAVLELLRAVSTGTRTVLLLDDVHWADRDTLALLEYLAGGLQEVPATIVVAARNDQAVPGALDALRRHARVRTIALGPLSPGDVALLARRTAGGALPPEAEEYLAGVSDGVPLLVAELVTGLVESGTLVRERGGWRTTGALAGGPPPSLSALVEGRVAALAPGVRELIRTAAVLGPELEWRRLAAVSGLDATGVADALRTAVDAGLLARDPAGDVRWRHALTCSAVLAGLTTPERAAIAAQAADALDGEGGVSRALVADLHALGGHPARAAALLVEEARDAVAAGAIATAHDMLERAVVLAAGDSGLLAAIAVERIEAFALATRTEEAVAVADAALGTAAGPDRTALAVAAARACVAGQHFDEAGRYLALAGEPDDPRVGALAAHIALHADDLPGRWRSRPTPRRLPRRQARQMSRARRSRSSVGRCGARTRPRRPPLSSGPSGWPISTGSHRGASGPSPNSVPPRCSGRHQAAGSPRHGRWPSTPG